VDGMAHQDTDETAAWGRVLVIMPTYNERESLGPVSSHLLQTVPGVDLLIVDDNSPDGTGQIAEDFAANDSRIHVLHREGRLGLGTAYVAGFDWGIGRGYDVVVPMDADGSHPAETLPAMLDALASSSDTGLVIGSRWTRGGSVVNWPKSREALSRTANLYARIMLRLRVYDITGGYRAYPTAVLRQLSSRVASRGYSFHIEMTLRVIDAGFSVVEVPIVFKEREAGVSKMNSSIVVEAMSRVTRWGLARRFGLKALPQAVGSVELP